MPSTKPPSGTRDYLPETVAKRRYAVAKIESVFQRYGFLPLETPAIENLSTLLGKYGEEGRPAPLPSPPPGRQTHPRPGKTDPRGRRPGRVGAAL